MNLRQAIRHLKRITNRNRIAVIKGQIASEIRREAFRFARREVRNMSPLRYLRPDPNAVENMRSMFRKLEEDLAKQGLMILPPSAKVEILEVRKA